MYIYFVTTIFLIFMTTCEQQEGVNLNTYISNILSHAKRIHEINIGHQKHPEGTNLFLEHKYLHETEHIPPKKYRANLRYKKHVYRPKHRSLAKHAKASKIDLNITAPFRSNYCNLKSWFVQNETTTTEPPTTLVYSTVTKPGSVEADTSELERIIYLETSTMSIIHKVKHLKKNKKQFGESIKVYHMALLIVADQSFVDYHKELDYETYILSAMNMVSDMFYDLTLGMEIDMTVVRIIYVDKESEHFSGDTALDVLTRFCKWANNMRPRDSKHPHLHDVAILITRKELKGKLEGRPVLGATFAGSACVPCMDCAVVVDTGLLLGVTIGHHLGHLLGAPHDNGANGGCPAEAADRPHSTVVYHHVMAPHAEHARLAWSSCSRAAISRLFSSGMGSCLEDVPPRSAHRFPRMLAGAMFNANGQCNLIRPGSRACSFNSVDFCRTLYCKENESAACYTNGQQPAQGTPCGINKWCFNLQCVHIGYRPYAVNGRWSDWLPWGPCSRTCGAGVQVSRRFCNNPPAAFGGHRCLGSSHRERTCNIQSCDPRQPSFRSQQCAEFNDVYISGERHTWLPLSRVVNHDPCGLYCVNECNVRARLKARVRDGTPCRRGTRNICVNGVCTKVGCDWRLNSNTVEDVCGVCDGDGSTCLLVDSWFNETAPTNKDILITKIPEGSRRIKIFQAAPSASKLAITHKPLRNETDVYLVGGGTAPKCGEFLMDQDVGFLSCLEKDRSMIVIKGPLPFEISVHMIRNGNFSPVHYSFAKFPPKSGGTYWQHIHAPHIKVPEYDEPDEHFFWEFLEWTGCSARCEGGTERAVARCVSIWFGEVNDHYCKNSSKPGTKCRVCNVHPCRTTWHVGPWTSCNCNVEKCSCKQTRQVFCMREPRMTYEAYVYVDAGDCTGPKPPTIMFNASCCNNDQIFDVQKVETTTGLATTQYCFSVSLPFMKSKANRKMFMGQDDKNSQNEICQTTAHTCHTQETTGHTTTPKTTAHTCHAEETTAHTCHTQETTTHTCHKQETTQNSPCTCKTTTSKPCTCKSTASTCTCGTKTTTVQGKPTTTVKCEKCHCCENNKEVNCTTGECSPNAELLALNVTKPPISELNRKSSIATIKFVSTIKCKVNNCKEDTTLSEWQQRNLQNEMDRDFDAYNYNYKLKDKQNKGMCKVMSFVLPHFKRRHKVNRDERREKRSAHSRNNYQFNLYQLADVRKTLFFIEPKKKPDKYNTYVIVSLEDSFGRYVKDFAANPDFHHFSLVVGSNVYGISNRIDDRNSGKLYFEKIYTYLNENTKVCKKFHHTGRKSKSRNFWRRKKRDELPHSIQHVSKRIQITTPTTTMMYPDITDGAIVTSLVNATPPYETTPAMLTSVLLPDFQAKVLSFDFNNGSEKAKCNFKLVLYNIIDLNNQKFSEHTPLVNCTTTTAKVEKKEKTTNRIENTYKNIVKHLKQLLIRKNYTSKTIHFYDICKSKDSFLIRENRRMDRNTFLIIHLNEKMHKHLHQAVQSQMQLLFANNVIKYDKPINIDVGAKSAAKRAIQKMLSKYNIQRTAGTRRAIQRLLAKQGNKTIIHKREDDLSMYLKKVTDNQIPKPIFAEIERRGNDANTTTYDIQPMKVGKKFSKLNELYNINHRSKRNVTMRVTFFDDHHKLKMLRSDMDMVSTRQTPKVFGYVKKQAQRRACASCNGPCWCYVEDYQEDATDLLNFTYVKCVVPEPITNTMSDKLYRQLGDDIPTLYKP